MKTRCSARIRLSPVARSTSNHSRSNGKLFLLVWQPQAVHLLNRTQRLTIPGSQPLSAWSSLLRSSTMCRYTHYSNRRASTTRDTSRSHPTPSDPNLAKERRFGRSTSRLNPTTCARILHLRLRRRRGSFQTTTSPHRTTDPTYRSGSGQSTSARSRKTSRCISHYRWLQGSFPRMP
jgi:hypothetical protein